LKRKKELFRELFPATMSLILIVMQIALGIIFLSDIEQNTVLAYIGVGLYVFPGWIFGMLPIFEFRRNGGVKKGKSYVHTTKLVDTGIYSIVRHPQYITWMCWAVAGMFLFQHWSILILGTPVILLTYVDLIDADEDGIKKFGEQYKQYMRTVPRANVVLGIIRRLQRNRRAI